LSLRRCSGREFPEWSSLQSKTERSWFAKGYGFANLDAHVPATRYSIFQAGSIGKQFTVAAILLLEEHGKLRLDDRYLPVTHASWGSITLRHLLTHTSGIPEYEGKIDDRRDYSERQLTEFVGLLSRRSTPGEKFEYSNSGYLLLGVIIRTVTGKFRADYIREHRHSFLACAIGAQLLAQAQCRSGRHSK
jgi:CubicO group peptidase (beta-lactamase class C family)